MTASKPQAYSYLRFSSSKQALGDSQRRQIEATEAWAVSRGLRLDQGTYSDLGVSGWRGKNSSVGQLANFLAKAKSGEIAKGSYLVIESLDRLTRQSVSEALPLWLDILKTGIKIVTLAPEPKEYSRASLDNIPDLMMAIFNFAANNEKSEVLSKRLKAAYAKKRQDRKPMTQSKPYWISLKNGKFELIPERAEAIRLIVQLCFDGFGIQKICKELNKRKVKPFGKGKNWSISYVTKILSSTALKGEYQPKEIVYTESGDKTKQPVGKPWQDYYPRILSNEDFDRLQALKATRINRGGRTSGKSANLFSGWLRSAKDNQTYERQVKGYAALQSSGVRAGLQGADTATIPLNLMEQAVLFAFLPELAPIEVKQGPNKRIGKLIEALAAIDQRIKLLSSQLDSITVETMPFVLGAIDKANKEKASVESELQSLRQQSVIESEADLSETQRLISLLKSKDTEETRIKLRNRLSQLVVRGLVFVQAQHKSKYKAISIYFHLRDNQRVIFWLATKGQELLDCGFPLGDKGERLDWIEGASGDLPEPLILKALEGVAAKVYLDHCETEKVRVQREADKRSNAKRASQNKLS